MDAIRPALLAVVLMTAACNDRCETLCEDVADRLGTCRTPDLDWGDLGATSRRDWVRTCTRDWDDLSADLSSRQLEIALDECGAAEDVVPDLTCDEIRALYMP
jgi:hypothetical protein